MVENAGLEIVPHRGGSLWGLPLALVSPSCTMAESFPEGSPLLEAMTPRFENGDYPGVERTGVRDRANRGDGLSSTATLSPHRLR